MFFRDWPTSVEERVQLTNGSHFDWSMAHPGLLMSLVLEETPALQELFARGLRKHPNTQDSPWSLVIGFDEFAPGDKLKVDNARKAMVVSFSFRELGAVIRSEFGWFTGTVVRSSIINEAAGGWSAMMRQYLHVQLLGANGLSETGVAITIHNQPLLFWAKLTNLLSDGDGHRQCLSWRGASGIKPCFFHWNVFSKRSAMAGRREGFVDICCSDPSLFQCNTSADVAEIMDMINQAAARVDEGTFEPDRLEKMEQLNGMNHCFNGLVADRRLRVEFDIVQVVTMDWMHSALQDGFLTKECSLVVRACRSTGVTFEDLRLYLDDDQWTFPKAIGGKLKALSRVFSSYRVSEDSDKLKCSASELIGLYAILRHYVETKIAHHHELRAHVSSFQAACEVVDAILLFKNGVVGPEGVNKLDQSYRSYLSQHKAVYGSEHITPKAHWMFDFIEQLRNQGFLLDAFIIERLHLRAKAIADTVDFTGTYERSVLAKLVASHCYGSYLESGLIGKTGEFPLLPGVTIADQAVHVGLNVSVGDICFRGEACARCVACASEAGAVLIIVELLELVAALSPHSIRVRDSGAIAVWNIADIQGAHAWYKDGENLVVLLI